MTDEERERARADFVEKYAPWYKKMDYHPMLQIPAEPWRVDARWLVSETKNAAWDEVKDLYRNHSLMAWWNSLKGETKGKIPKGEWDALDVEFVEKCVKNSRQRIRTLAGVSGITGS